jgi:fructose-specific phosphotransferase system component IIB
MYAVEFETKISNGIIEIPMQYKQIKDSVKVIIMTDIEMDKYENKSIFNGFLSTSKQVDLLKSYNRDDLHER